MFDLSGNLIYTIKKDYEKMEVSEAYKSKIKKDFIKRFDIRLHKQILKTFEFESPKYFPAIKDFLVVDDKMYIKTYGSSDDKEEYIIMNLKGNFLKKIYLPKTVRKCYAIKNNRFYYLKENEEEEEWELYSIVIN